MTALATYLSKTGKSQAEIGRLVGVKQSVVSRWATGDQIPSTPHALALADATNGEVPVQSWAEARPKTKKRKQ